jgi:hypothetical protein
VRDRVFNVHKDLRAEISPGRLVMGSTDAS